MKKAIFLIVMGFFALSVTAQQVITGSEKTTEEIRKVGDFNQIVVRGPFEVKLTESKNAGNIKLDGAENIIAFLQVTTTSDGILAIALPDSIKLQPHKNNSVKITVPYSTLNQITLVGSGEIVGKNTFTNNIIVRLDGAGSIDVKVKAEKAEAIVLGSGNIKLNGRTDSLACKVVGSGNIDAHYLRSYTVNATISGPGTIEAESNKAIKGRISGSGTITFTGDPAEQDFKKIGSGEFKTF
ncbi:DUF2807 domain-containing protein [Flavobacterium salilacus subsp. salilacus]|uniref:head GIN domain-containing protein n=1 Tax=Flavobacterium TaxID=237 RepID=UPI0010751739|nr:MULTISPECIES: head GIN domain-containing protein [Flavobacterium]KAF2519206.1 DUF2807 domain-containing protein [Flavobacterium salilacus subsp. salilacus]MBE1613386.1 DUF2807 domain-containing protein [Flavobacterium sp. SaA2.13]